MLHVVTAVSAVRCTGIEALNPACQLLSLGGSVASDGVNAVLSGLSQWVASGAEWLLAQIGDVLVGSTSVDVGASWFTTHYQEMGALSGAVLLPLLLVSTLQAIYRQSASHLLRVFFLQLPLALLLGVVGIQVVRLCLAITDAMCNAVAGGSGSDVKALLAGLVKGLVTAVGDPSMATFVLLLVGLLVAVGAFVLWLELLIRAAAVYAAVLFLPLALATLVWPAISHMARRLVETIAALILSKFVIVATLSLAAGAISSGTSGSGFASVLAGGALLVLATFTPFTILRLIPMIEAGAVGHLEGVRQRGTATMTRAPRAASRLALDGALDRMGGDRLLAAAGPVGTGSAATSASGSGSSDPTSNSSTGRGRGPMHIHDPESGEPYRMPWREEPDGSITTDPGPNNEYFWKQHEAFMARPKGPSPIRPAPTFKDSPGAAEPPEPPYIGNPGPRDNKYVMGHNAGGPYIKFVAYGDREADGR
jgi:hypothetical protein